MMLSLIPEFLNMVVMYMFYNGKDVGFLGDKQIIWVRATSL